MSVRLLECGDRRRFGCFLSFPPEKKHPKRRRSPHSKKRKTAKAATIAALQKRETAKAATIAALQRVGTQEERRKIIDNLQRRKKV